MAKVIFSVMKEKFPEALDKDLLNVVGNLIYYRYIEAVLIAKPSTSPSLSCVTLTNYSLITQTAYPPLQ